MRSCHEWGEGGRWTRAGFIGAISKAKMLIDALDVLEGAATVAAIFKPSSVSMSILVFEIAPINRAQTACVC